MPFDRFLIAPFQSGLQTNMRPWLIPDDAFAQMQNAYVWRGRVRKRFGSFLMGSSAASYNLDQLLSRLRINLGNTSNAGAFSGTVPGIIFKIGQMFSIGTEIYTVYQLGTPGAMLDTGVSATATYNTTTGAYNFVGAPVSTAVFFYPAEPVMGLTIFENGPVNNQPSYAFDTQFVYIFSGGAWSRTGTNSPVWQGKNLNFFWTTSWRGTAGVPELFVSNFRVKNPNGAVDATDDPMYYLNSSNNTWTAFQPLVLTAGNIVETARILVPFKSRLILLNTIEVNAAGNTNTNYVNRCRFSQVGDPTATDAFLEITQVGALGGGVIDAPTDEAIITAEFIKDRLIVYFERSTYELAYTNNDIVPFQWNKINTELGSESTFSVVPFDTEVLAIGSTGVHSCNGSNVVRIDANIPDNIFEIKNANSDTARVAGIRDYFLEMVYWTYPKDNESPLESYPNKVLVYNYQNKTWAENDDCITCFGYFEQGIAITWASSAPLTWAEGTDTWEDGYVQALARQVVAGNQQGFTFIILENPRNAAVMQLTNATLAGNIITLVIIDHTLAESNDSDNGDYITIENALGAVNLNGLVFPVNSVIDANTISVIAPNGFTLGGTYTGGGQITRVSNIKILSKQWNPYDKDASNVYLAKIDFGVVRTGDYVTGDGQITVDYFPSASEYSMIDAGVQSGSIMGNNVLETTPYNPAIYPFEEFQNRLWHPVYFQTTGECIQIYFYFQDFQMRNLGISWTDFELEGMVLHTSRSSSRLQ